MSIALVLGLLASLFSLAFAPASANGTLGSFEIDGNLADDPAGEPIDWSTPPPNLIEFEDDTTKGDDVFNTGSKQLVAGQWDCRQGSAPDKSDLDSGQIASRVVNGKQFLYFNFTRVGVNGDAHVDYEVSQSTDPNPVCPALPKRTAGDLLFTFDTDKGGKNIQVRLFRYAGDAFSGTFTEMTAAEGLIWDGAVNIPNSIPGHRAGDFGEASLNLTDSPIGTIACGQFAKAYMKTRASTAIDSALKDRTAPRQLDLGCPESALAKAVRNVTSGGSFGTTASAEPGDVLEYRLSYSNNGTGDATDVTLSDEIEAGQTFLSCSNDCTAPTPPATTVSWDLGTVPANTTEVVTFRVTLDSSFPVGTTTIDNTAVVTTAEEETPTTSTTTTVTVTSTLVLGLVKSADGSEFGRGDQVTYTLDYSNTGNSAATNVVITETVPANTSYVSCTGGCTTNGPPVTTVRWSLGTVPAGGTGSVTMTVAITSDTACEICNVATIAADGASASSNRVCIEVVPEANPAGAQASGSALGASITDTLLSLDERFSEVSSATQWDDDPVRNSASHLVVDEGPLRVGVLETESDSSVTGTRALNRSEAASANVDLFDGAITASAVRAVAETTATGTASSYSSTGSSFKDLFVNGVAMNDVAPGTRVDLPGIGYAVLYEEDGETSSPTGTSGGFYSATLTVNMIHVHVVNALGVETAEIVVSQATSSAKFAQTTLCLANPVQSVSGHAFIASEVTNPLLAALTFGYVDIPPSGGASRKHVESVMSPADGSTITAGASTTESRGKIVPPGANTPGNSTASSYAEAAGVCLVRSATGCTVSATAVRSQANSTASATGGSSNDQGTMFVDLVVAGIPVSDTPAPNTVIDLPGVGYVILNEQVCDSGTTYDPETRSCPSDARGHSGITIRAIHLVVPGVGGDIVVAEAHADSRYS